MKLSELYKALADDSRLRILRSLRRGLFNVQELTSVLESTQSTVSHHLKALQNAGLIRGHREGTWCYYGLAVNPDSATQGQDGGSPITHLISELTELLDQNPPPGSNEDDSRLDEILHSRRAHTLEYFERVAPEWESLRSEAVGGESFTELVMNRVSDDAAVLDLGCGSGALLARLASRRGTTIGVDQSPRMLEEARRVLGPDSSGVDLRLGTLEHLPVADSTVDIAIAYMVLHHVPSPAHAVEEAFRVLVPGGKLVVVDLTSHDREYMRERYADLWLGFDPERIAEWGRSAGFARSAIDLLGAKREVCIVELTKEEE